MTLNEFIEQIESLIVKEEDLMIDAVRRQQNRVLSDLVSKIESGQLALELDRQGNIKASRSNRIKIKKIQSSLSETLKSEKYFKDVQRFQDAVDKLSKIQDEFYSSRFKGVKASGLQDIASSAKARAAETMTANAMNTGLEAPIKRTLDRYLTGGSLKDLKSEFQSSLRTTFSEQDGVIKADQIGLLEKATQRYVRDALNQFTRSYDDAISQAAGTVWYRYSGGLVRDTRDFCRERNGGYYTEKEVKSWSSESWQGKNRETTESNIKELLGGYNCRHRIIPVAESAVPQKWKDRAKELGF